jgi:hypothetical protein
VGQPCRGDRVGGAPSGGVVLAGTEMIQAGGLAPQCGYTTTLCDLLANRWACNRPGAGPGLSCWVGVEPPRRNRTATHPYHRCVGGSQRLSTPSFPHNRAVERLCVAQFLANLWQGPCMAAFWHKRRRAIAGSLDREQTHPWCSAVLRRVRVERRTSCEASFGLADRSRRSVGARGQCAHAARRARALVRPEGGQLWRPWDGSESTAA